MEEIDVLIVGAGPTGLVLALSLVKQGIRPLIIDKKSGPGLASRAMAVQARTLEIYRQLGIAANVVSKGIPIESIRVLVDGDVAAQISLQDFGSGLSPYPFVLSYPQDEHETLLVSELKAEGLEIQWNTELLSFGQDESQVTATIVSANGQSHAVNAKYLCGCDGARSIVRKQLALDFAGGTYDKTFFVADVEATGDTNVRSTFNICLSDNSFLIVLPIRSSGMNRLIGVVPEALEHHDLITFEDLRHYAEKASHVRVENVNWFSIYKVHHRVAEHFQVGRTFLCGDAGHVHSPVGGQGMNTGIGDSFNLAWKLAAVLSGKAIPSLLDTYEPERIAFAHSLVETTDTLFKVIAGSRLQNKIVRETIFPHLLPFALGFSAVRRSAFRVVSQIEINYNQSALSSGTSGVLTAGDRLPWVQFGGPDDNFFPLRSLSWQVHIYGTAVTDLRAAAEELRLPLFEFEWSDSVDNIGLKYNCLYLVRPDGYIGFIASDQNVDDLRAYLKRFAPQE